MARQSPEYWHGYWDDHERVPKQPSETVVDISGKAAMAGAVQPETSVTVTLPDGTAEQV